MLAAKFVVVCFAIMLFAATEPLVSHFYSYAHINVVISDDDAKEPVKAPVWLRNWDTVQFGFTVTTHWTKV